MWGQCGALAAFVLRAATAWRALDSLPPLNACVSFDHVFGFRVEFGVPSPQPWRSCSDGRVGSFAPPNHLRAFAMRSAARLLLALVRSRLLVVCTVAAFVRATPLMDPRLWRARVLLRLSCSLVLAAAFAMRATPLVIWFHWTVKWLRILKENL